MAIIKAGKLYTIQRTEHSEQASEIDESLINIIRQEMKNNNTGVIKLCIKSRCRFGNSNATNTHQLPKPPMSNSDNVLSNLDNVKKPSNITAETSSNVLEGILTFACRCTYGWPEMLQNMSTYLCDWLDVNGNSYTKTSSFNNDSRIAVDGSISSTYSGDSNALAVRH